MGLRALDTIIIHCSATPPDMDVGAAEIRTWHLSRKFCDIGYHYVIRRSGAVEAGRPIDLAGAHCKGHNANSIGVCLVGGVERRAELMVARCNFTELQWVALEQLVKDLVDKYPSLKSVHGHNEFASKACPCFDVQAWLAASGLRDYINAVR